LKGKKEEASGMKSWKSTLLMSSILISLVSLPVYAFDMDQDVEEAIAHPLTMKELYLQMPAEKINAYLLKLENSNEWQVEQVSWNKMYSRSNKDGKEVLNINEDGNGQLVAYHFLVMTKSKKKADQYYQKMCTVLAPQLNAISADYPDLTVGYGCWTLKDGKTHVSIRREHFADGNYIVEVSRSCIEGTLAKLNSKKVTGLLEKIIGTWYDSEGKAAFFITADTINGAPIQGIYNYTGGATKFDCIVRLGTATGYQDHYIEHTSDGFEYIVVDEAVMYTREQTIHPVESVGGIYIGMGKNAVQNAYGIPTKQTRSGSYEQWHYGNEKFKVTFQGDRVTKITMYNGGNRSFDHSGLNCQSSLQEYYTMYHLKGILNRNGEGNDYAIGGGIYLNFDEYPNAITLELRL
jgi:hypothetical protein